MSPAPISREKARLRKLMRNKRKQLSPREQAGAGRSLCRVLMRHSRMQRSRDVALYLANDGELDPQALLLACHRAGKRLWLPCLRGDYSLSFRRFRPGDPLTPNRYGIDEPRPGAESRDPMQLDLVLLPLVAFDARGNRLGMGGGFYDRTFSRCQRRASRPCLVGIAHSFQQMKALPLEHWDIPLAAVATESAVIRFREA